MSGGGLPSAVTLTGITVNGAGGSGGGGVGSGSGTVSPGTVGHPAVYTASTTVGSGSIQFNALNYGCVPDDSTDNSTCISTMFTAGNAVTVGIPTYVFPCSVGVGCIYKYSGSGTSPISPTIASTILCEYGAGFDYAGTAHALDVGATGLSGNPSKSPYRIEGCRFLGAASATQGIYLNPFLSQFILHSSTMFNFGPIGSSTYYRIYCGGSCYQVLLDGNWLWDADGNPRNLYFDLPSISDWLRVSNNWIVCTTDVPGATICNTGAFGIAVAGAGSSVTGNIMAGYDPLIQISPNGNDATIDHNEIEGVNGTPAVGHTIELGRPTDSPGTQIFRPHIHHNYYNSHADNHFAAVATSNDTTIGADIDFGGGGGLLDPPAELSRIAISGFVALYNSRETSPPTLTALGNNYSYAFSAGAGAMNVMNVDSGGSDIFAIGGTGFWNVNSSGQFNATTDAGNDIGTTTHRPRDVYAARSVILGDQGLSGGQTETFTSAFCETNNGPTTLNTGATTTTTGLSCLPANSIIDAVVGRVTTTITGSCTGWELGDGTTAARFSSNNTGLTAGTTTDATHIGSFNNTGIASATTGIWQAAASKITITCAGGNPSAGAIRISVYYHTWTAPTQ
jgi:hypothetical protein